MEGKGHRGLDLRKAVALVKLLNEFSNEDVSTTRAGTVLHVVQGLDLPRQLGQVHRRQATSLHALQVSPLKPACHKLKSLAAIFNFVNLHG